MLIGVSIVFLAHDLNFGKFLGLFYTVIVKLQHRKDLSGTLSSSESVLSTNSSSLRSSGTFKSLLGRLVRNYLSFLSVQFSSYCTSNNKFYYHKMTIVLAVNEVNKPFGPSDRNVRTSFYNPRIWVLLKKIN